MTSALLRFSGVQKSYDGQTLVVRDLDLDIYQGEFLTLLGPSGSGKTTTLMMLAGFESPSAGEIFLKGQPITRTPPHERNFGMVFQNYALFPHMTVEQNIAYPLRVRKLPAAQCTAKVDSALEMVQMHGMQKRYPSQLSGGQQQRVALARALVFDPQLVLMDEPLGALDKQLREHMQIELKDLHRRLGLAFVYVTHDQAEALTMSDRVAVFHEGVVQQIDRVDRLYDAPANRFVASFIGDQSTLSATVVHASAGQCSVRVADGTILRGQAADTVQPGDAVLCSIRPERITAHSDAAYSDAAHAPPTPSPNSSATQENHLRATVSDTLYFGDHLRLRCTLAAQTAASITVKLPLASAGQWQAGQALALHFPPAHLRIYQNAAAALNPSPTSGEKP